MWNFTSVLVFWAGLIFQIEACSQPMGWTSQPPEVRLAEARLVVRGTVKSVVSDDSVTRVTVDVGCVTKNLDNVDIASEIHILQLDVAISGQCVDNIGPANNPFIAQGDEKLFMLTSMNPEENTFEFSSVNVQGAAVGTDIVICDFIGADMPQGMSDEAESTCPSQAELDALNCPRVVNSPGSGSDDGSTADSIKSAFSALLLLSFSLLLVHF